MTKKRSAERTVRDIRRATRRHYSAEEKIRIVLEGLRGEDSIAELCRREGINSNVYYRWSKEFLEAGKKRLSGDTAREATSDEVKQLPTEASALKETLAELLMENRPNPAVFDILGCRQGYLFQFFCFHSLPILPDTRLLIGSYTVLFTVSVTTDSLRPNMSLLPQFTY